MNRNLSLTIIIGLLAIGFLFRLLWLDKQSFWLDEGYTISISSAIAKHGYPLLDSGLVLYKKNIAHHYLVAGLVKVYGTNPWSIRIISVIFGTAGIYLLYLLAKKLFHKESIALLAAGFLTFAHWHLVWSRQGRSYAMLQFLYLATIYTLLLLLEKFSLKRLAAFMGLSLATILTHDSGIITLPFGLAILAWHYKAKLIEYWQKYKLRISLYALPLLAIFAYLISTRVASFVEIYESRLFFVADDYLKYLLINYSFLFLTSLFGLWLYYQQSVNKSFAYVLCLFYILALSLTISITDFTEFRYIFYLFPLMITLATYAVVESASFIKDNHSKWSLIILILVLTNWHNLDFIPKPIYALDTLIPNPNFNQAYQRIKETIKPSDLVISPYIPLDVAYLGRSDYWLMMSFSGKPIELASIKYFPYDSYHKKPALKNLDELKQLMKNNHGYIIIDDLARGRLGYTFCDYIETHSQNIYTDINKPNSSIWVYRF